MNYHTLITAQAGFEAARRLQALPAGHRAARLHGHSFLARVRCAVDAGWAAFPGGEVDQLCKQLQAKVQELDYRDLNERLAEPDDATLARWLHSQLQQPGLTLAQTGVRSHPQQGVELSALGQAVVWRRYVFQSAHQLPNVPAGHKCGRMHGHGFEVVLHAHMQPGVDADRLDALWAPMQARLDHACLNDIPGLENPTSECMSAWLWQQLQPQLPALLTVTVYETASCGATYDGSDYRIWKELTLDSAVQLMHAPDGSPLRRLHGHTYTLRLHLCAPLNQVMGWTVDFGDVKEIFTPIFRELDHHPLHQRADLADCDAATLARWVLQRTRPQLPQLERVEVFETAGCGASVSVVALQMLAVQA